MNMKKLQKILSLLLAAFMMISCLAACGDKDEESDDKSESSGVPTAFEGKLLEPYIKIILSGSYTYEATQEGGTPVTYAKDGDDKILLTTEVTVEDEPVTLTIMYIDGKYYVVLPAQKAYTEATSKEIKKYNLADLFSSMTLDNFANSSFVASGTETIDGTEYQYEDYYSALVQITNRFYFDSDDNLVYVGKVNKNNKVKAHNSIKIYETNSSTFDILSSYDLVDSSSDTTETTTSLIG